METKLNESIDWVILLLLTTHFDNVRIHWNGEYINSETMRTTERENWGMFQTLNEGEEKWRQEQEKGKTKRHRKMN